MNLKYAQLFFLKKAGGQIWKIAAFRHNELLYLYLQRHNALALHS